MAWAAGKPAGRRQPTASGRGPTRSWSPPWPASRSRTRFETRDQARREVFAYIETYYNRQRAHSAIGYITPEQAELRSA
ncbi:hypothetical protein DEW08_08340 [Azospirillum thermophilum]|uniref:Integrase catalytic domain-containing protein n=1 Tax=Azospirillum thermophilum TaxID=2202148 RepID=A0A2S2CU35_9PROT|nr:hypothetical protein DEW08_08340 [Azospirillum thermophilum]